LQGVLFTGMCAAVFCLEMGEGQRRRGHDSVADADGDTEKRSVAQTGCEAFGGETIEAVIVKFANYASCGLALTLAVPAAFRQLGLR
jgi:hypothetical protein